MLFISGGLQALEKINEKLEAQNFDKVAQNIEEIKKLIEDKVMDPNEYASYFPGLPPEELEEELGEIKHLLKDIETEVLGMRNDLRSVLEKQRARDKRDRAREEKERAMAEEIDLKDREIQPEPIARGGFGSVHRAK